MSQYATTHNLTARIALHRYGSNPRPWYPWVLDQLPLRLGQHVLEAGAGTGELWTTTHPAVRLTLTDASAAMCESLRDKAFPAAQVVRCGVDRLPFAARAFDGAVANHMLYHLDNPTAGLRELHRVLRLGAWIATATNGSRHMSELNHIALAAGVPDAAPATATLTFTAENGPALLARLFTDVQVLTYPDTLTIPTADPVVAYLTSCTDRTLAAAEISALHNATRNLLRQHGTIHVTKHVVLITARKPHRGWEAT